MSTQAKITLSGKVTKPTAKLHRTSSPSKSQLPKQPTTLAKSSRTRKRAAASDGNESSSEEEVAHRRKRKKKRSKRKHVSSDIESTDENDVDVVETVVDDVEEVEEVNVNAEEGDDVSHTALTPRQKLILRLQQELDKRHHVTIPADEEDEDTTRDIKLMFSDIVKVAFNVVDGKGESAPMEKGPKGKSSEVRGRWCLICK